MYDALFTGTWILGVTTLIMLLRMIAMYREHRAFRKKMYKENDELTEKMNDCFIRAINAESFNNELCNRAEEAEKGMTNLMDSLTLHKDKLTASEAAYQALIDKINQKDAELKDLRSECKHHAEKVLAVDRDQVYR